MTGFMAKIYNLNETGKELVPEWVCDTPKEEGEDRIQLPCKMEGIIECEEEFRQGYRNKTEFTIG